MRTQTAIYPGSFDPVTRWHLAVVRVAQRVFDRVVVLIAQQPHDLGSFSIEDRLLFLERAAAPWRNVDVDVTHGTVLDYANRFDARYLIRGLREPDGTAYDSALADTNPHVAPSVQTIFIPADPRLARVSSNTLTTTVANYDDGARLSTRGI